MQPRTCRLLFTILVMLLPLVPASAQQSLTINSGLTEPYVGKDHRGFYDLILKQLAKMSGIDIKLVALPSERALLNANSGIDDGNIARVAGINKLFPNLVQVPESITEFSFIAFSHKKDIDIRSWDDLKDLNIAYINGWKIFDKKVHHYKSKVKVANLQQLFYLLHNKRVDVVLLEKWIGLWWLHQTGEYNLYRSNPIVTKKMYLFLHKKHKDLVPGFSKLIREMKQNKSYQKIRQQSLEYLLEPQP